MPYPFTRADERRERPASQPGVLVELGSQKWFFPGGTEQMGMALARCSLGKALDGADVRIEFGTKHGADWVSEKVIKAPKTSGKV